MLISQSYFQSKLKLQYQSISVEDMLLIGYIMHNLPVIINPIKYLFVWSYKVLNGGNLYTTPFNLKLKSIVY